MSKNRELVGHIGVDAGCVYIGDPCYEIGSDTKGKFKGTWADFCGQVLDKQERGVAKIPYEKGYEGQAIVVNSGYGDGHYPVYVERKNGVIARVIVDFLQEGSEDVT